MACVLAIESSCDETAASIVVDGHLVLSDPVATQIDIHRKFGGVVPELASRNHVVEVIPVIEEALEAASMSWEDLDAIAVTRGPGLVGALLVGLQVAKSLAYAHDLPLIPVHHLAGHLHAVFLHRPGQPRPKGPAYPHIALAVSGGHTALYEVLGPDKVVQKANTRDDAAGEAFDKVARMLGLGYPGGPIIEKLARGGREDAYKFSVPIFKDGALDFSFSGLKTAVLTAIKKYGSVDEIPEGQDQTDLLASFQAAAVKQLVHRTVRMARSSRVQDVVLSGGVACNGALRNAMREALAEYDIEMHVPPPRWCTDNAAMIAGAADHLARQRQGRGHHPEDRILNAIGSWRLDR
ncbi:MAG: tRNA (adenosine(37)-N6)-threonylcarbamoyltransferase complex transferase subunit TsaD [Bradymonadia bacterium]